MGDNFLKQQVQNFKRRRDLAMDEAHNPDLFRRPETISTVFTAQAKLGQEFQPGENLFVAIQPDGTVVVTRGHKVVGTISGDGAAQIQESLLGNQGTGIVECRVGEVTGFAGTAQVMINI